MEIYFLEFSLRPGFRHNPNIDIQKRLFKKFRQLTMELLRKKITSENCNFTKSMFRKARKNFNLFILKAIQ